MIREAGRGDAAVVAALASLLWNRHSEAELAEEFAGMLAREGARVFLYEENGAAVGFAQCQLRRDYVEGTETSPVGYLEGIFVQEPCCGKGCAKALLAQCQRWAKERGCREFASDCEIGNQASFRFHRAMGFAEANRIVCFTKKL